MWTPPILCVAGHSGWGKTQLLAALTARLGAAGVRVGTVKHCEHVDLSPPGKDSARHAAAGASPAIAVGPDGIEVRNPGPAPSLLELAAGFCGACDVVLGEGFHGSPYDKILVHPADSPRPRRPADGVRTVVGAGGEGDFNRSDLAGITEWVRQWLRRRQARRKNIVGVVLTGGQSKRMGFDKATMRIGDRCVLERLCELLADRTGEVLVVGRRPRAEDAPGCVGWRADDLPGRGPMGGIVTALRAAGGDGARAVCVAACDMPALGGAVVDHLLDARDPGKPATVAVHPTTGRIEPLLGVYEPAALGLLEAELAADRLSLTRWLDAAGAARAPVPEEWAGELANANTPEELEAICGRLSEKGAGSDPMP